MSNGNMPNLLCGDSRGLSGIQFEENDQIALYLSLLNSDRISRIAQNAELTRANATLSAEVERRDEALCLYSEVVRLYQEQELVRPREVDFLLARIRALIKK